MSTQHAQYVLLFLVLVINSDQFQILQSYTVLLQLPILTTLGLVYSLEAIYSSRPFLCALDLTLFMHMTCISVLTPSWSGLQPGSNWVRPTRHVY